MKYILFSTFLLFTGKIVSAQLQKIKIYAFTNGSYFDGTSFKNKTIYTIDGRISFKKPADIDSIIDVSGKYIIPPFGEAHNHNVEWYGEERFNKLRDRYLKEGIFYVKNPNNLPKVPIQLKGRINIPESIDACFSNGSFTAPGGHPLGLVKRNIEREVWLPEDAEGGFYYSIANMTDFFTKWESLKKTKPDFVKTYLLYSEEFDKRFSDTAYFGWKGLNPSFLKAMVTKIHSDGYKVVTHVETAMDFHNALLAKVDEVNHIPGFRAKEDYGFDKYRITNNDAKLASKNKTIVVTTVGAAIDNIFKTIDSLSHKVREREMIVHNLTVLKKNKVLLAIGSDAYGQTSRYEVNNLLRLNLFDNLSLLKMWCETTVMAIFPDRKIGYLKEGYEANFLVLRENPLIDFKNTEKILMRVKSGIILLPL